MSEHNEAEFLATERGERLPVFGPSEVFSDEETQPAAIVRVAYALSREQLLTALSIGFTEIAPDRDAENLTVDEVRREVEGWLASESLIELDRYVTQGQLTAYPPEAQRVMDALAAAVDRAYLPPPVPAAVQAPRYEGGRVWLQTLDHGEILVSEPRWCLGHDGQPVGYRADITHNGRTVAAEFEGDDGPVEFLRARISWAPFGELQREPHPVVDVEDIGTVSAGQLRELAAETALHAGRLYRLSNLLERILRGQS